MTKTILVLLLSGYSLTRVLVAAFEIYAGTLHLPYWVLGVTAVCSLALLWAGFLFIFGRLRGGLLRQLIFLNALCALINLTGLRLFPVNDLTTADLIVTGTTFDILFFLGTLPLPIRDTARMSRAQCGPYGRVAEQNQGKRRRLAHSADSRLGLGD